MTCPDCATAAKVEHHGFADGCKVCKARGIARIFLRKGRRGRELRKAAEWEGITEQDVERAWKADASNPEKGAA